MPGMEGTMALGSVGSPGDRSSYYSAAPQPPPPSAFGDILEGGMGAGAP